MRSIKLKQLRNIPSWIWSLSSGLLLGFSAPGFGIPLTGMIAHFPLFIVFDRIQAHAAYSQKRKLLYFWFTCWSAGSLAAGLGAHWMIHSIHVFGHFPWFLALIVAALGYGLEISLNLLVLFALPAWCIQHKGVYELFVRLSFVLMLEPFYPKIFQWSYGGLTFNQFPWLAQVADLVGAAGLGVYCLGFSFMLLLFWRGKVDKNHASKREVMVAVGIYTALWTLGLGYGSLRGNMLDTIQPEEKKLHVAALQPNFSLEHLASNPELAYSNRENTMWSLIQDSLEAISQFPQNTDLPKLLIWPESVYSFPYFKEDFVRQQVEYFAKFHKTHILLASADWDELAPNVYQEYGISVLIGYDGKVKGRYNKIFLIPFGEYIPAATIFPFYADWLRKNVPALSEFNRGTEYTVFQLSKNHRLSSTICFDIFSQDIIRNMTRNGAELVINLSNLAWFGKSNASAHMELAVRWKAIENRIPILLVSNNGRSLYINALGQSEGTSLELFEKGALIQTLTLQQHYSFYREFQEWIHGILICLFMFSVLLLFRTRRCFDLP
ncbi:apolipoprotein N-acyltransferase [Deltaproteobacteria bacterium TL4]